MNIYVGNLASNVTEDELRKVFEEFGEVTSLNILKDRYTNESRGFGFVEMPAKAEALEAIQKANGLEIKGKSLIVNEARPKTDRKGGGGRRGGGSRGRGGRSGGRW